MNNGALNRNDNNGYKHDRNSRMIYDEYDTYLNASENVVEPGCFAYPSGCFAYPSDNGAKSSYESSRIIDVNASCICKKYITNYDEPVLMVIPCQHLIHMRCIEFVKNHTCPICDNSILGIVTERDIKRHLIKNAHNKEKRRKYHQMYVNMKTACYVSKYGSISYVNLATRSVSMISLYKQVQAVRIKRDVHRFVDRLLDIGNINITVLNKEKFYEGKKVVIANHASMLDTLFIGHTFDCGALMSAALQQSAVIRKLAAAYPVLVIKRGKSMNAVNMIQKFIDKNGSIVILPEGLVTHPNTLIKFRSGSFHTGFPVQPVIIKYEPYFFDKDPAKFIMKLMSQDRIDITITVMDVEVGPFSDQDIENVRNKMGQVGNLALSDLSNRDIVDK